jgi:hypothetical protein
MDGHPGPARGRTEPRLQADSPPFPGPPPGSVRAASVPGARCSGATRCEGRRCPSLLHRSTAAAAARGAPAPGPRAAGAPPAVDPGSGRGVSPPRARCPPPTRLGGCSGSPSGCCAGSSDRWRRGSRARRRGCGAPDGRDRTAVANASTTRDRRVVEPVGTAFMAVPGQCWRDVSDPDPLRIGRPMPCPEPVGLGGRIERPDGRWVRVWSCADRATRPPRRLRRRRPLRARAARAVWPGSSRGCASRRGRATRRETEWLDAAGKPSQRARDATARCRAPVAAAWVARGRCHARCPRGRRARVVRVFRARRSYTPRYEHCACTRPGVRRVSWVAADSEQRGPAQSHSLAGGPRRPPPHVLELRGDDRRAAVGRGDRGRRADVGTTHHREGRRARRTRHVPAGLSPPPQATRRGRSTFGTPAAAITCRALRPRRRGAPILARALATPDRQCRHIRRRRHETGCKRAPERDQHRRPDLLQAEPFGPQFVTRAARQACDVRVGRVAAREPAEKLLCPLRQGVEPGPARDAPPAPAARGTGR